MPKGIYGRKRKPARKAKVPLDAILQTLEQAMLRAYTAGADATAVERAHVAARVAYVRLHLGLKWPRRRA